METRQAVESGDDGGSDKDLVTMLCWQSVSAALGSAATAHTLNTAPHPRTCTLQNHLLRCQGLCVPAVAHRQPVAVGVQRVRRLTGRVAGVASQPVPVQEAAVTLLNPGRQLELQDIHGCVPEIVILGVDIVRKRGILIGRNEGTALCVG